MVALNTDFAASKPATDRKNRVGRFFSLVVGSVGKDRCSSRKFVGKKRDYRYDATSIDTEFEYGSFGELIRATGEKKDAFNFRFSTKYEDSETRLLYYGYRYYDAATGRWLNRDPIGERGGLNLYGMLMDDPISWIDLYGLKRYNLKYDLAPSASIFTGAKAVEDFSQIMDDISSKIGDKYSEDGKNPCHCIESIKIGGHGGPGLFFGDGTMSNNNALSNFDFENHGRLLESGDMERANSMFMNVAFMNELSKYMCSGGLIEIVACEVCAGAEGDEFTENMESIFGEGNFKGYEHPVKWGLFGVSEHPRKPNKKK